MSFLEEIEPVKQLALAEMRAAANPEALEQARITYLGANGKLTALMKRLGTLSKEEKPAAGKLINSAKAEIEAALADRKAELDLLAELGMDRKAALDQDDRARGADHRWRPPA